MPRNRDEDPGYNPYTGNPTHPPPPPGPGGPGPTTPQNPATASYFVRGTPSQQLLDVLYPGYKVVNGQFVYSGKNSGVGGLGGGSITNPQLAADYVNKLWDPLSHGDYRGFWNALGITSGTSSPDTLKTYEPILRAAGFQLNRNAAGDYTDFTLPNGMIVDPLKSGGAGGWQWLENPGQPSQAEALKAMQESPLLAPWTKDFNYPEWKPPSAWQAPTNVTEQNDPGYKFRLEQGQLALEHAAAAKGTLLSGQTMKDLTDYMQNAASAEYGNVYARGLTDYQTTYNASQNDWLTNYNKALQGYQQSYNIFENNQAKQFNRLASVAGYGQTAAGSLNAAGLGYSGQQSGTLMGLGNSIGNIYTGQGNAAAAGQVGSANAWGNAYGNLGNFFLMAPYLYGNGRGNNNQSGYGGFMGQGGGYW